MLSRRHLLAWGTGVALEALLPSISEGRPARLVRAPYLQSPTLEGMTLAWQTDTPEQGEVRYWSRGGSLQRRQEPHPAQQHALRLTGLQASTDYFYQLYSQGEPLTPPERFHTARTPQEPITVCAWGDSGIGSLEQYRLAEHIRRLHPDVCLHTGDVFYPRGEAKHYDSKFFLPYQHLLKTTALFPSMGNHEYMTKNGQPYLDAFYLPTNNLEKTERYYSFDYGPAHVVALDTNQFLVGNYQQLDWLDEDLRQASLPWKIIFGHHPLYSSPHDDSFRSAFHRWQQRRALKDIFLQHKVDVALSGHSHFYERSRPLYGDQRWPGILFVVTGAGGVQPSPAGKSRSTAFSASRHHFVTLRMTPTRMSFQAVGLDGQAFDQAEVRK